VESTNSVTRWTPHRGCQPAAIVAVRGTCLMSANVLRAESFSRVSVDPESLAGWIHCIAQEFGCRRRGHSVEMNHGA
jgi:hypothetical protein